MSASKLIFLLNVHVVSINIYVNIIVCCLLLGCIDAIKEEVWILKSCDINTIITAHGSQTIIPAFSDVVCTIHGTRHAFVYVAVFIPATGTCYLWDADALKEVWDTANGGEQCRIRPGEESEVSIECIYLEY